MGRVLARSEERRRQAWIRDQVAELLPEVQLSSYGITLADPARRSRRAPPLEVRLGGRIPSFLDMSAAEPALDLPLGQLRLGALLASEGERRLPLVSSDRSRERIRLVISLPDGLALAAGSVTEAGTAVTTSGGWTHALRARTGERGQVVVAREVDREAFRLEAHEVGALADWAGAVDARESERLALEPRPTAPGPR